MYPSGHPKYDTFLAQAHEHFSSVLSWASPLRLVVDRNSLLFDDVVVYTNTDNSESLAFLLYKDGIREIAFEAGLERDEVSELATAFNMEIGVDNPEDDLATYLWEKELEHVSIAAIDDYFEEHLPSELRGAENIGDAVRDRLQLETFDPEKLKARILTKPFSGEKMSTIPLKEPFLSPENIKLLPQELTYLRKLLAKDEQEVFFDDMLEIVFTIIHQEHDEEHVDMYISLFENLLLLFLSNGPLEQALHLVRKFRQFVLRPGSLSSLVTERLSRFLDNLGSPRFVETLGSGLERGGISSFDALPDLLELFPPSALASLVGLLETVSSMKARKSLCTGLARLGEKDIQALTEGLPRHPWYVTRNIAYTLGLIGGDAVLPYLGALTTHGDVRVRKEALRTLNKIGGPPASDWIFQGLFHTDAETRMQAIRSLPKDPSPGFAARIQELVASAGFDQKRLGERQAFYRLLGSLSSDSILPWLKESLTPRRWFASRAQKESRLLAAAALAARNTPAARGLLRQALPGAGPEAREIINECLSQPVRPGTEERWE
jgi:hypothetical protein